jgi:hypothetical protein
MRAASRSSEATEKGTGTPRCNLLRELEELMKTPPQPPGLKVLITWLADQMQEGDVVWGLTTGAPAQKKERR